jgi:ABC-type transport system substrate-binding protein
MSGNYWASVLNGRIRRRRALAIAGGSAFGAALLAACGGGSDDDAGPRDTSGLLSEPEDTTKQAVRGGTWQTSRTDDPVTLDVTLNNSSLSWTDMLQVYQHLTKAGLSSNKPEAFEGDAAGSWEFSPDGLQVTYKLRPGIKFDARQPTNGRVMDAADVRWSFDRFAAVSPYRAELFNRLEPAAPIESYSTPDNQTFVIKLAFPYGAIIEMTGYLNFLYIVPKEAETFDLRSDMRGSGPFRLSKFTPSVALEYERNADYYVKDRPFLDGIRRAVVPEYATGLAQFKNKTLWNFGVRQEDILQTKREHPELVMQQVGEIGISSLQSTAYIAFSQRPDTPLKDVRLRRAASMLIDRELFIQTQNNTDMFTSVGLPAETWWNAHLPTKSPNWVDPRDKAFGENGKWFQYNPDEALKLVRAASGQSSVTLPYFYQIRSGIPNRDNEVFVAMLQEGGAFKINAETLEYTNEWREVCQRSAGEAYMGFCQNNAGAFNEDGWLVAKYTPQGKYSASYVPIPGVTDEVLRIRKEIDPVKRNSLIQALVQNKLASEMYDLPIPGRAPTYSLRWPWFKNHDVFESGGDTARKFTEYWYDATKRT